MKVITRTRLALFSAAVAALSLTGGVAAQAAEPAPTADEAEAVFLAVADSADPAQALSSLSPDDRALFDLWATPTTPTVTTTSEPVQASTQSARAAAAAADCSTYTTRGSFSNQLGATLGEFWTTGEGCASGTEIGSVSYVDGGGRTSALGWSYQGADTGQGVSGGAGFVYGSYKFKLNIGGVDVQQPSYCARAVFTYAASHGDNTCGIG